MKIYHSFSSRETENLGETLAKKEIRIHKVSAGRQAERKHALIFALHGDLGSGKTTFVRGFFRGLRIKSRVKSPTFIIMRRSAVRGKIFSDVFHIDAYRMRRPASAKSYGEAKPEDVFISDFKDIIKNPRNIILIEWPENTKGIIPRGGHRIEFRHGKKENERTIIVK